jgi:hypothetical protein
VYDRKPGNMASLLNQRDVRVDPQQVRFEYKARTRACRRHDSHAFQRQIACANWRSSCASEKR